MIAIHLAPLVGTGVHDKKQRSDQRPRHFITIWRGFCGQMLTSQAETFGPIGWWKSAPCLFCHVSAAIVVINSMQTINRPSAASSASAFSS
jgi:hypothetical protein